MFESYKEASSQLFVLSCIFGMQDLDENENRNANKKQKKGGENGRRARLGLGLIKMKPKKKRKKKRAKLMKVGKKPFIFLYQRSHSGK